MLLFFNQCFVLSSSVYLPVHFPEAYFSVPKDKILIKTIWCGKEMQDFASIDVGSIDAGLKPAMLRFQKNQQIVEGVKRMIVDDPVMTVAFPADGDDQGSVF